MGMVNTMYNITMAKFIVVSTANTLGDYSCQHHAYLRAATALALKVV